MRGTWNPTRRNRNIGTVKSGYGEDNKFVIPESYRDSRTFWQKVDNYNLISRDVDGRTIKFIIEPTKKGFIHCCTVDDILYLLKHLPIEDVEDIGLFIFRQPKKKERIISPTWGRIGFDLKINDYSGPGIIIEAIDVNIPMYWKKSLDPDLAIELERLKQDRHQITSDKRNYIIDMNSESARATQLYRTIIHEIGHWKQWKEVVIIPSKDKIDFSDISNKYFSIPLKEREAFAHRYADKIRNKLIDDKIIPFKRQEETL